MTVYLSKITGLFFKFHQLHILCQKFLKHASPWKTERGGRKIVVGIVRRWLRNETPFSLRIQQHHAQFLVSPFNTVCLISLIFHFLFYISNTPFNSFHLAPPWWGEKESGISNIRVFIRKQQFSVGHIAFKNFLLHVSVDTAFYLYDAACTELTRDLALLRSNFNNLWKIRTSDTKLYMQIITSCSPLATGQMQIALQFYHRGIFHHAFLKNEPIDQEHHAGDTQNISISLSPHITNSHLLHFGGGRRHQHNLSKPTTSSFYILHILASKSRTMPSSRLSIYSCQSLSL